MAIQTQNLVLAGLGITGNTSPDGVQPVLPDGIHLRWSPDPKLGFPPYGFYLFRRLTSSYAPFGDGKNFCDVMKTKGFTAPTTLGTTYSVEPGFTNSFWKVVSDQPLKLILNPQFFATWGWQIYSFDLSGRQYTEVFFDSPACDASVFIDFVQNGSIVVTAMIDDIVVATQTATGTTNTFREVRLQADHFNSLRFSSGPAVLGDIGWTTVDVRAKTYVPWDLVPGVTQPITLPIGNASYPAQSANTAYTTLRSTAIGRVLYNRAFYQALTPTLLTSTGTVALTNGSPIVIGTGTNWTQAMAGETFAPNGHWSVYTIAEVVSATKLVLNRGYLGTTASGATYKINADEIAQFYDHLMALFDGGTTAGAMYNRSLPPRIPAAGTLSVTLGSDVVSGSGTSWTSTLSGLELHVVRPMAGTVFVTSDPPFIYGLNTAWDDNMVGCLFQIAGDPSYYTIEAVNSSNVLVLNRALRTITHTGWFNYTVIDPTPYQIASVVSTTSLRLDRPYEGSSTSGQSYHLFASYSDAASGAVVEGGRQYPIDTLMLASLNPSFSQMLGLYWVDQSTAGATYDYLIAADYGGLAALNPQTALAIVRAGEWWKVEAYYIQGRRAQPATALQPPADLAAYALPAASEESGNNVGLRWTTGVTTAGNLQPDRPVLYHLWRARRTTALNSDPTMLATALTTAPLATDYTLLTQGQPILVVEQESDTPATLQRPPDWPPYRLYAFDGDLALESWYTYALTGVDLFGRHSARTIATWNQWLWNPPPALNLPQPWYFKSPAGEATINAFGIELLDKVPPPVPVGVEAFLLDPADPYVVKDTAYTTWRNVPANANVIGVRVRWQWTQRHADQAPDTVEFRLYYHPGPNAPTNPQLAPGWQTRINVQAYAGVKAYEVFLNLGSLVTLTTPDLATPTAYAYIGVSAADGKTHTRDVRTSGSNSNRVGNEGKLGGPSRIFRVLRTKPNPPGLPAAPSARVFATKADYYGKSSFTYTWTAPSLTGGAVLYAHIFRALDETVFQIDWDQRQVRASKVLSPTLPAHQKYFPVEARWDAAKRQQVATELNALNNFAYPTAKPQALAYYRALSDDGLRVLAGLEGNQLAFTQLATFARDTSGNPIAVNASVGSYTDTTLDGRATNRYFYRVAFFDKANNLSELSIASPPIWLPDVMPPRTPTIVKAAAGDTDKKITITWATVNREADLQEYRLYRAERALAERELATLTPNHTRLSSSITAGTTEVSWDDGPQTIVQHGYEDGTAQGWVARGTGVTLASVTTAARTGTRSLRTTGRTMTWHGPSLDVRTLLTKGATYQISGYVRLVTGQAATDLVLTVERTPVGGTAVFDRVAASPASGVTDAGWALLQGLYTYTTDVSGLVLYLESSSTTSQFYLEDFSITLLGPPMSSLLQHGFEDTTTQGWAPRGTGVTLASVTNAARTGTRSLRTTGRTMTWHGPSLDVRTLLVKGGTYLISGYVRLVTGQAATDLIFTVERTPVGGTAVFDRVAASTGNGVTATAWVQLQGLYTYTTDVSGLVLYMESTSATSQFYLDDFSITPLLLPTQGLRGLVNYYYSLVAVDTAGNVSAPARAVARAYDQTPPAPPNWKLATPNASNAVVLTWWASVSDLRCLVERRAPAGSTWQQRSGWLDRGVYTFTDARAVGEQFVYRLRVMTVDGRSNKTYNEFTV